MQFAFARARRGLTTLFVCQSREKLWVQRPAAPRDDGCSESEVIAALQKISIKYVRGERDLREPLPLVALVRRVGLPREEALGRQLVLVAAVHLGGENCAPLRRLPRVVAPRGEGEPQQHLSLP